MSGNTTGLNELDEMGLYIDTMFKPNSYLSRINEVDAATWQLVKLADKRSVRTHVFSYPILRDVSMQIYFSPVENPAFL